MFLRIDQVLTPEELKQLHCLFQAAPFVDGKLTAGTYAKAVKENQQLQGDSEAYERASEIVLAALRRNILFEAFAQPLAIRPILFSRYQEGMGYGTHMDNTLMGRGEDLTRCDLSLTLFLSDPRTYEGGELLLDTTWGEQSFKLAAGSMVVYPKIFLHRVAPVTQGVRLVAVTWVQSRVRDPLERELLFELDTVRHSLFEKYGKTEEFDLLCKVYANLLLKWVEV